MKKEYRAVLVAAVLLINTAVQGFAAFDSAKFNESGKPLEIARITPDGEDVPPSRQIVFSFNRPVVPVGRMERKASEIPVTITPALECEWRWLNTSSLACQLTEKNAMQPATRYQVTINPGIKAEDGSTIKELVHHVFLTQRPQATSSWFRTWEAAGLPVIQVRFNQPVDEDSVEKHLFLELRDGTRRTLSLKKDSQSDRHAGYDAGIIWEVTPSKELPLDNEIRLNVEPGIISLKGAEAGVEKRTLVTFNTFPEFHFIGIRCYNNDRREIIIEPDDWSLFERRCDPLSRAELLFSAPVIKEEIKEHLTIVPDIAGGRTDYDPWANVYSYSRLSSPHRKGARYSVPLPEVLKAFETYRLQAPSGSIKDEFGRPLKNGIDIGFSTDHRRPDYHLGSNFSVLEKGLDTDHPLIITNIDKVDISYDEMSTKGKTRGEKEILPGKAQDVSFRTPLGIRKLVSGESGIVQGRFETEPRVPNKWELANWFFSEVTPFSVHVKIGHFNSAVWVTDFATGEPVEGVTVDIYKDTFSTFSEDPGILSTAITDKQGLAELEGTKTLDPELKTLAYNYWDWFKSENFFIRCTKGKDIAVVPLIQPFEVQPQGTNNEYIGHAMKREFGHMRSWGTTAQGIYKAGDVVQFKFYVRNQNNKRFISPPVKGYSLKVIDPMGKTVYEISDISLSEFGAYDGEFKVSETGAVGWYRFILTAAFDSNLRLEPIKVLVSDFTPAPFRVSTELNGELFKAGDEIKVATTARLHAGGPYVDAQTRITATLKRSYFSPKKAKTKGFYFDTHSYRASSTVFQTEQTLDDKGNLERTFMLKDAPVLYGRLTVESAVRDDRGKYIANSASAAWVGRDRFVGIRQKDWVLREDEAARVEALVVNPYGDPEKGVPVEINVEYRKTTASRVKSAGNAYITHYNHEWIAVDKCSLTSSGKPVFCEFRPEEPGSYRITAKISDSKGRSHSSSLTRWVVGKGRVLWETPTGNTLNIYPEKEELRVGEKARYLVQNPYPGAKALITIERYGVLKSWVETFEDSTKIIEFDLEPDYLPGFYLSVTVMSPRVEKPLGEGEVDLGKPAFRSGYVKVPVKDPYKEITVDVLPDRKEYRPRDRVRVQLKATVKSREHRRNAPSMEIAVAVLDESVFDLLLDGKDYFDPYSGFYGLEPLDLKNYSLLMQLIGRQKFEQKGANTGGGGGPDISLRSLFKFVSYWNPSVKTDGSGRAAIDFKVPDNLTGWRVLAMAVTRDDRMGLGEGTFRVNKPTEIRPVLPNQVTESDRFTAGFSVMNRTKKSRNIRVEVLARGAIEGKGKIVEELYTPPYKRRIVWLPVKTKGPGTIDFTVTAKDDIDGDGLKHTLPVHKRVSLETAATYGTTASNSVNENFLFPEDIRTDVGQVSVVLSPTVIGNIEGAFAYLRDYPYICWEQKLTKGVMAAHYINLKSYIPETFEWPESVGLPEETLKQAASFQAPNGGMVYYIPQDRYVSPYLSAYTALAFNWLKASGYTVPAQVEKRLHDYLLKLLRKDVMPDFYSKGMASTVRAVSLAALAPNGKVTLSDMNRYRRHVPQMSLFGKAHYLKALLSLSKTEKMRKEAVKMILAQANETGGKFIFSETLDSGYERILASPLRDNCAVLTSLLDYGETPEGEEYIGSAPFKLVRTITQTRGNRSHWENTQENMFCMNALTDFSRVYEKDKPKMTVLATFDHKKMGKTKFGDVKDKPVEFDRPIQENDPGKKAILDIKRFGKGRLYYSARLSYAPLELKAEPINSGIEVRREYSVERNGEWTLLKTPMQIETGELVRVDLYLSLPSARNFVVVNDPVPGGLEPVNRDLATASAVDAEKGNFRISGGSFWYSRDDWMEYGFSHWSFYHKELRHDAVRFYSEYIPTGNYHLAYVAQAIAPGEFTVMPTHAEEMYDPDVFGKWVPSILNVDRKE